MHAYYVIAFIFIFIGIRFVLRARELKSVPRVVAGAAVIVLGIAQLFWAINWLYVSLIVLGLVTLLVSLVLLGKKHGAS